MGFPHNWPVSVNPSGGQPATVIGYRFSSKLNILGLLHTSELSSAT